MNRIGLLIAIVLGSIYTAGIAAQDLKVLPDMLDGVAPADMMKHYLLKQVNESWEQWKVDYEKVITPEDLAARQKRLRELFVAALGGFPERTPLNAQVTGAVQRDGYRVEKILFESQPKLYVTAALFVPESEHYKPPYPGVLIPCGHAEDAKVHMEYQTMGALLALNGMMALVFDPIEQGERKQLLDEKGKYIMWGTRAHTMGGIGCMLVGRNTATYEIWDGMRAMDYLESRPEVDPKRLGCTGNSGGGTQTAYLMSLDDRIMAAAPSCYIHRESRELEKAPGDAEQNIYGQLAWGMEHGDYLMMRAPVMPVIVCAATEDFFDINATWETFRYAKRMFTRIGYAERVDIMENAAKHNYNQLQRQSVVRWMARWLCGRDEAITEPEINILTAEELQCTPKGQVMLMEGARTTYDLNADYENELASQRQKLWASETPETLLNRVREIAKIRNSSDLPKPEVQSAGQQTLGKGKIEKLILKPEPGIYLPALLYVPEAVKPGLAVVYVNEAGKDKADFEQLSKEGALVLAVDLRGTGETKQTGQKAAGEDIALDWEDQMAAYALGRTYVGMRTEDVLVCAQYALDRVGAQQVHLVAEGSAGVPALHAAALEPGLFTSVKLVRTLRSWSDIVHARATNNQLANAVHGALLAYDLPDLVKLLGPVLTIEQPLDALGKNL
ncbi:MAG TPA: alpha/beta hydrolase family protein [Candidatus Hydrogenedentes bacterium]|mgnify:CR=1 FL=1|nr:alpha/beta hydrolase family protein [Candidatus Hydrogenedentota bacterium]